MTLRFLTAGESHGKALVGILEGVPSGLELSTDDDIQPEMRRRKLGYGRGARQKIESDQVDILSGVRGGLTLGSPVSLILWNQDWKNWENIMAVEPGKNTSEREVSTPRPGHADFVGGLKYDHKDMRNVLERASARETAMRVALGCIARKLLQTLGVTVMSRVVQIGNVLDLTAPSFETSWNPKVDSSPVRCLDSDAAAKMIEHIRWAELQGDTLGGEFEVCAFGVPLGLGSYSQWDRRLEAEIGKSFLSLNAIKTVTIGAPLTKEEYLGSRSHDQIYPSFSNNSLEFRSNLAGGITGGMSTGQPLLVRAAMKPLATLMQPLSSVNMRTGEPALAHVERSDVCAVPAAAVIAESILTLTLCSFILEKFGGDTITEIKDRVKIWNEKTKQ